MINRKDTMLQELSVIRELERTSPALRRDLV